MASTAKVFKVPPLMTDCPICGRSVHLKWINSHLDSANECVVMPSVNPFQLEEKKDQEINEESVFDGSDSEFENLDLKALDATTTTTPKKKKSQFRASRSISNNPSRFGESPSSSQEIAFMSPSPKRQKTGNSPFSQIIKNNISSPGSKGRAKRSLSLNSSQESPGNPSTSPSKTKHVPINRHDPDQVPYYVVNFEFILRCVVVETDDRELFTKGELEFVKKFNSLHLSEKKLFVRLFQRKHSWLKVHQIRYEEIPDIRSVLVQLTANDFLVSGESMDELITTLNMLSAPDIKNLAKEMNVTPKGTQKQDYVQALMNHSKHKNIFVTGRQNYIAQKIMQKASRLNGDCYRVSDEPRKIFLRILSLYSLTNWWDERESESGQPQQLTTLLLVNQGKMTFPTFDIIRKRKIFQDRDQLLKFEEGCSIESKMSEAFESKNWELGLEATEEAENLFQHVLEDENTQIHVRGLPVFLRKFTLGSILAYILTKGVEVYERTRKYERAVKLLNLLIGQDLYLPDYHGHWYERVVLDLDQHLKRPSESLDVIRRGLADPNVRLARKLALQFRVLKICNAKKNANNFDHHLTQLKCSDDWLSPKDPPTKVLKGKLIPKDNRPGAKSIFIYEHGGDQILCSVEEFVREVYKQTEQMSHGLHAEGAVVNTVAAILFWDILYDLPVDDAFRSPNQAKPLDFDSDDFYENRKDAIEERLLEIERMSEAQLKVEIESTWSRHFGVVSCVNWEVFRDPDHLLSLVTCWTRHQLRMICERLIKNHRHTRSGFPDLTMWNPQLKKCLIVEVKGPNDRLSNKQILWIEYLNNIGVKTFVCHVEATGGKFLSPAKKRSNEKQAMSPAKKGLKKKGRPVRKEKTELESEEDFLN